MKKHLSILLVAALAFALLVGAPGAIAQESSPISIGTGRPAGYSWQRSVVKTSSGRIVVFSGNQNYGPLYYQAADSPYNHWSQKWLDNAPPQSFDASADSNNVYIVYDKNSSPCLRKLTINLDGSISQSYSVNPGSGRNSSVAKFAGKLWAAGESSIRYTQDIGQPWYTKTYATSGKKAIGLVPFGQNEDKLAVFYLQPPSEQPISGYYTINWGYIDQAGSWRHKGRIGQYHKSWYDVHTNVEQDGAYSITSDASGNLHVVYLDTTTAGESVRQLKYRKYDSARDYWSDIQTLNTSDTHRPSITAVGNKLWVLYSVGPSSSQKLVYLKSDGSSWKPQTTLDGSPGNNIYPSTIVKHVSGSAVSWTNSFTNALKFSELTILQGDVNSDGVVNIFDMVIVGQAFGSTPGDSNWDPRADVNGDGKVDIFDLTIVGRDFGKSE